MSSTPPSTVRETTDDSINETTLSDESDHRLIHQPWFSIKPRWVLFGKEPQDK